MSIDQLVQHTPQKKTNRMPHIKRIHQSTYHRNRIGSHFHQASVPPNPNRVKNRKWLHTTRKIRQNAATFVKNTVRSRKKYSPLQIYKTQNHIWILLIYLKYAKLESTPSFMLIRPICLHLVKRTSISRRVHRNLHSEWINSPLKCLPLWTLMPPEYPVGDKLHLV